MKKVLFIAVVALLGLGNVNAQDAKFGAVAGFHNLSIKASGGGGSISVDGQGFYVGFSGEFVLSEDLNLQTELQYASASKDGESTDLIVLPILAKYYVSEEFSLQAGPQLDFLVSESDGVNVFGLGLAIGAGYDISEKLYISTRYAFGLTNRLEDAPSGVSIKFNTFQAGLGYRF
ncbi:porin family protein [Polaribacter sp. Q13]|uniref:porin family protein n=1 Tax=Polaribacter sp. Q13 TaxID=2806551 RepID=UPI00193B6B44|nr:porin family protein [Polaribacter sp. Q13]QVY65778.1 PorT family protein [Polaribacter sp. Q13]